MSIYIDNEVMNGKKAVCEFLKIDPHSIPAPRRKKFQMNVAVIDKQGTKRSNKSLGGKAVYNIYVPHLGRHVEIRWAMSQKKVKDNVWLYTPKTIWMLPAENGEFEENDDSKFLYWYLNPLCRHSPFKVEGASQAYGYQDKNAEAVEELDREEKVINAMSIIVGNNAKSDSQLATLAKGLGIAGVDDMTPALVKKHLKTLAHADPTGFFNKAQSREIVFSGKVQQCIDKGILVLKNLNGMQRWYLLKNEILPIQFGQDPTAEIKNHLAEKWYLYADQVNEALQGIDLKSKLDNAQNDEAFESDRIEKPVDTSQIKQVIKNDLNPPKPMNMELAILIMEKIRKKEGLEGKVAKWAAIEDLTDPNIHPATKQALERTENKEYIAAYKATHPDKYPVEELV